MDERKRVLFRVARRKEVRRRRSRLGWMIFPSRLFQLVLVLPTTFFPRSLSLSLSLFLLPVSSRCSEPTSRRDEDIPAELRLLLLRLSRARSNGGIRTEEV